MKIFINTVFWSIVKFMSNTVKRRVFWITTLCIVTLVEFIILGIARRTFIFYTINDKTVVVEDRMLKHAKSYEDDIIRYIEEVLLGPVSPDLLPLFPGEARLNSLIYRNGVVYADFTEDAALPPIEGGETLNNFQTLHDGILRNFSNVKDTRFFIKGTAIFSGEFRNEGIGEVPDSY
jgi:hypothetical protein